MLGIQLHSSKRATAEISLTSAHLSVLQTSPCSPGLRLCSCVPPPVHFGMAKEQLTPHFNSHSSNVSLCLSPHTYRCHQVTSRPMPGTEGGSADTGSKVLVQHLMDVRWPQLEVVLRWAVAACVDRGGGDRQDPGDQGVFQQNRNQAVCWENGFAFL